MQLTLDLTQPYNEISHKFLVIAMTWFQLRVSKAVDFVMLCRIKRRIEFCTKCNSAYVILDKCRLIWRGYFCTRLVFNSLGLWIFLDKNVTAVVLAFRTTGNNINWHLYSLKAIIMEPCLLILLSAFLVTWQVELLVMRCDRWRCCEILSCVEHNLLFNLFFWRNWRSLGSLCWRLFWWHVCPRLWCCLD